MNTTDNHDQSRDDENVVYLPFLGDGYDAEDDALDAELVAEQEVIDAELVPTEPEPKGADDTSQPRSGTSLARRRADLVRRWEEDGIVRPAGERTAFNTRMIERRAAFAVGLHHAVTSDRTKSTGHTAVRQAVYVWHGCTHLHRQWRMRRDGLAEQHLARAYQEGDQESARWWAEHQQQRQQDRRDHRYRMATGGALGRAKSAALYMAGGAALLLVLGVLIAVGTEDIGNTMLLFEVLIDSITWTYWVLAVYGLLLLLLGTGVVLAGLRHLGRKHGGDLPTWAAPLQQEQRTSTLVDESLIMTALRTLGHGALNQRIRDGWGTTIAPSWIQPPIPRGKGWEFALRLPNGVPVSDIAKRKDAFAHNLGRAPSEVWIEADDKDAAAMRVFVLDPGALREPVPAYPLLGGDSATDFWKGFPVGIDARWNPVVTSVFERNFVTAGVMGSGKSTLLVALLAGAVLDPLVDIDVFCFAENNDYRWLEPVAATVSMGNTPENVARCQAHIEALMIDLERRGKLLARLGLDHVTREAAAKYRDLRPRLVVVDECQSFFRQDTPDARRAVVNNMVRFYSAARKYGVVLLFATPTPSDQSLPRDLVAITTNRACFAINDRARNNVVLGERAYESGLSALDLKPRTETALNDVGTCVSVGFMDTDGLLRSYHLNGEERASIAQRGVELRGGAVNRIDAPEPEDRDVLDDVARVLGGENVKATDVAARLRSLAPEWVDYNGLTAAGLRDLLRTFGVVVTQLDGVLTVRADRVDVARAGREGGNDQ